MASSWLDPAVILKLQENIDSTNIDIPQGLFGTDIETTDIETTDIETTDIGMNSNIIPEEDNRSEFAKGLVRGWNNMQALTGDSLQVAGELLGKEELAKYGAGVSAKNRLEAANVGAAEVGRVEDVSFKNLSSFVSNSIGEALPSFVPALSGAAALNVAVDLINPLKKVMLGIKYGKLAVTALGAYLPSAFLGTGEAASEQKDMAGTTATPDPMQALFTGLKAGALDALTVIPIVKAFKMKGGTVAGPEEIAELFGVTKKIAKKVIDSVPGILKSAGTAAVVEGPTELAQEALFITDAAKATDTFVDPKEFKSRLLNSFVQGTIGGSAIGGGARVVGNLVNGETVDDRLKINDIEAGTVIQFPNFETFQKEVTPEMEKTIIERYGAVYKNGIKNKEDFLDLQNAEIEHIVDKPLHESMQEIYSKGGKPIFSNYYGKGPSLIRYEIPGETKVQTLPVETTRLQKMKKGISEIGGVLVDKTFGKSIGIIAELGKYSPTAKRLVRNFSYQDDPIGRTEIQEADITEKIMLRTAQFSKKGQKAVDKVSKFIRAPFTAKISAETNLDAVRNLENPAGYTGSAQGKILGRAFAEQFKDLHTYQADARYTEGPNKGEKIGFNAGEITNYYPRFLIQQKIQNEIKNKAPGEIEPFRQILFEGGMTPEQAEAAIQNILTSETGLINDPTDLRDSDERITGPRKAANLESERKLKNIPIEKLAPYINMNLIDVAAKYRDQVVPRVELAAMFGKNNEILNADLKTIDAQVFRKRGTPLTKTESRRLIDVSKALEKKYKSIENPLLRKLNAGLITFGYVITLPFATISSLSEPFLVLSRGGADAKVIAKSLISGVKGIIRNTFPRFPRDEFDNAVSDIGIGMDAATTERLSAAFGGGQETNKFTEQFFRLNFLAQFTRWNRLLAAAAGRNLITGHAQFLSKTMVQKGVNDVDDLPKSGRFKKYQEQLRELGIDPQDAVDYVNTVAFKKNDKEALEQTPFFQKQIRTGSLRYVNEVVMNPRATTRPMWMSNPHLAIFAQLKGFQVTFSNTVLKRWYNEMFRSGFYNGMENGAKYAAVGAVMVVAAALGNEFREYLQYGLNGNKRYNKETDLEKLFRAIERTGFLGPIQFLLDSARAERFGSGPVEALMGPIVSRLVSYLEGVADYMTKGEKEKLVRELVKTIPILGSVPQIRDRLYEALGVESTFGQKQGQLN